MKFAVVLLLILATVCAAEDIDDVDNIDDDDIDDVDDDDIDDDDIDDVEYFEDTFLMEEKKRIYDETMEKEGKTLEELRDSEDFSKFFQDKADCPNTSAIYTRRFERDVRHHIRDYQQFVRLFYPRKSRSKIRHLVFGACMGLYHGYLTYNATLWSNDDDDVGDWNITNVGDDLVVIHHRSLSISCGGSDDVCHRNETVNNDEVDDDDDADNDDDHRHHHNHHRRRREYGDKVLVLERVKRNKISLSPSGLVRHHQCVCHRESDLSDAWGLLSSRLPSSMSQQKNDVTSHRRHRCYSIIIAIISFTLWWTVHDCY